MRASGVVCAVLVACESMANAQTPPVPSPPPDPALAYPIEVTERPLLLPSGVFQLDFSLDRSSYRQDVVDANGNTTTIVTSSGHEHDADLSLSYGLGPVDLNARVVNELVRLGATVRVGSLGVVGAAFQYYAQGPSRPYDYGQLVQYSFKIIALPKHLSFVGGLSARFVEVSLKLPNQPPASGTVVSVFAGGTATVQLVRRLSISAGTSFGGPISAAAGLVSKRGAAMGVGSTLIVAFHRWDLYAQGGLEDLTRMVLPFAAVGFVHRWF